MSGSLYLTHHNPDLDDLFDIGREIVTYKESRDCVEKVRYLLAHEQEREEIAHAGYQRAITEHTWQQRFSMLMEKLSHDPHTP
jgi:spore maturation protein CgeB